jgi:hypothetical protein
VATIEGGEGGFSLIKKSAGSTITTTMIEFKIKNNVILDLVFPAGPLTSLSSSVNIESIKILLINIPSGPDTIPMEVARPRSLSPNQLLANFVTGDFR